MSEQTLTSLRIEMRSDPRLLAGVRELVASVARRLGFDQRSSSQIALAVDEALANVICHGYERACDRPIWVRIEEIGGLAAHAMRIVIEDEARTVDCCEIKGRSLEDVRPGGLGVHIIREIMDEVRYEQREGGGMRLTLEKVGNRAETNGGGESQKAAGTA